jgi:hypothetical protein
MSYSTRTHVAPGDLGLAADQNQGMDNEEYLKSEHDLASPTDLNAGWRAAADTWVYASANTFTISGLDRTAIYQKGTRIRWKDGGAYKYAAVTSSAFSTNTTVTFTGGTDYTMANATVTDNDYSYEVSPQGYPEWFNYTSTVSGSGGSIGTYAEGTVASMFCVIGPTVHVVVQKQITNKGSWSGDFRVLLPLAARAAQNWPGSPASGGVIALAALAWKGWPGNFSGGETFLVFNKTAFTANLQWTDIATNDIVMVHSLKYLA